MTTQLCPYLAAVDDSSVYFPTPDAANRCYAVSSDEPAHIPLNFQASYCLTDQFVNCSRYRAAQRPQLRLPARRWLMAGGGLVALMMFAVCALLAVVALILGGSRLILLARATDTPQPTATPSPTWTLTASLTPTKWVTDTATVTPKPSAPTATVSSASSAGGDVVSPLATPTLQPTATQPWPTATQPRPTATRRLWPTATRQPTPTRTRGPTLTPSATLTRTPTATRPVTCRFGDTMTFNPASPALGEAFVIEVRSLTGYANVSLTGTSSPDFLGVDRSGSYYVWRWEDSFDTAGTYTYSFKIESGAATCVTKSVTVSAPTDTPTPTPTVTPVYEVGLARVGDDFRSIFTDTQPVSFELGLTNGGNITDSFQVWLDADPPQGWTAQYCIGESCSDYTVPGTQVTLPQGGSQALSIKVAAPSDAPGGYALSVTMWVESLGDPTKKKSQSVTVVVTQPTTTP
jgi:hypothetical protein